MTPAYVADPEDAKIVAKDQRYAAPAAPESDMSTIWKPPR